MVVFGFVGVEIYFSEESVFCLLVGSIREGKKETHFFSWCLSWRGILIDCPNEVRGFIWLYCRKKIR